MKITVIGPTHPYKGGISHFTTILVQYLRKIHNVDFISWKRQYPAFLYPVEIKDTQSKKPIKTKAEFLLDFLNPVSWFQSFIQIRKNKSDLLILTWVNPIQSPIYFILCFLTKFFTETKILYICHNVLPHEQSFYDEALTKLAFSHADLFIVHSREDKIKLQRIVTRGKKIILGFHPIYDVFNSGQKINIQKVKKQLKLQKKVLLFFGYIRPYKGLKYLIQAMPDILQRFPQTTLLIVGSFWSKDKKSYFDLIKNLQLEKNVVMINKYIPNEEIAKYFTVADVAVFPYTSATQSGTIQIAYAFNKPVISTAMGGLKDVMEDGVTGYIIKPKDTKDIAEKVKRFFASWKPNRHFNKFKSQFTWERYIELIKI